MFKRFFIFIAVLTVVLSTVSCSLLHNKAKIKNYVEVQTSEGSFIIGLYEGTPLHKENFMNNSKTNVYDSTLIYSISPNGIHKMGLVENKKDTRVLNDITEEKTIKNEIYPELLNKKGAVGMLRANNDINPDKRSNKLIFYIVDGIKANDKILKTLTAKRNAPLIADYITVFISEEGHKHYEDSLKFYKSNQDNKNYKRLYLELTDSVKPRIKKDGKELFALDKKQVETYTEVGGVPIYDGQYTVFGKIVKGIDILDKLSSVKTGLRNKPKKDIYIISTKVLTKKEFKKYKK